MILNDMPIDLVDLCYRLLCDENLCCVRQIKITDIIIQINNKYIITTVDLHHIVGVEPHKDVIQTHPTYIHNILITGKIDLIDPKN